MTSLAPNRARLTGIMFCLVGSAVLSINDVAIKSLSETYALHQVILVRALIGLALLALIMGASGADFRQLVTRRPGGQVLRVGFVMVSNVTYFLGLAALPLAEAVALAFISPLLVTMLSVLVLGEQVGPRRWAAVGVGLVGVVVMLRPGGEVFQPAALLVLISAFCYALTHMMTRRMRETESTFALNFYVQIGFVIVSGAMGLWAGDGHLAGSGDASVAFLFRDWIWPPVGDWPAFLATGVSVAVGGMMLAQAYRTNEAALIAPFEYVAMPLAIVWGVAVFGTWPDTLSWVGIGLICGSGLYVFWREAVKKVTP